MSGEFAGALSERILIERPVAERDAAGLQQTLWERVCECRASVRLESVGAQSVGQALSAMPRYRVAIRRRDDIALDQRVSWGARTLIVRQLLDDPLAKDRITMRCDEVRG
jgi:head-tail adaptor